MKNSKLIIAGLLMMSFSQTFVYAQGFESPEIRYGHHKPATSAPEWIQLMYGANPDPAKVTSEYAKYYRAHPFVKNTDTQYYKRWLRSFSRDKAPIALSDTRKQHLKQSQQNYVLASKALKSDKSPSSTWNGIGPIDFDKESVSRSYAPGAAHVYTTEQSNQNDSVLYAGTATAGVWKSTDKGGTWDLMTSELIIGSVVALAIDPTDDDVVYFGASNSLYKTTDGGSTWSIIGDAAFKSEDHYIPEIKISPANNLLVFVCSNKGFYRSTDGGQNLTEIMNGDFQELEFKPDNSSILYSIMSTGNQTEFYKSSNNGVSFTQQTNGWPVPSIGNEQKRTEIATTPAAPNKIIALCTGAANSGSGLYGIYVSNDAGASWNRTCCGPQVAGVPSLSNQNLMAWADDGTDDGGQYYYDVALEIADNDSNKVFVGGVNLWISSDGGNTFTCPSKWSHGYKSNYVHADIHDIQYFGDDLWISCDGGTFYSSNDAATIDRRMLGIQGSDFWGFGAGHWDGEVLLGGAYHNGTLLKDNEVYLNGWLCTGGGDGIRGFVNPGDARKVYDDYGEHILSGDRMVTFQSSPFSKLPNASYIIGETSNIAFHPNSHNTSLISEDGKLWITKNDGINYTLVHDFGATKITKIEFAWSDANTIYVGTYDGWWDAKKLWRTNDYGVTWTEITPPTSMLGGEEWVPYDVTVSSADPNTIWVARTSMYDDYPDIDNGQILKSTDGGNTYSNYSSSVLDGESITNIVHQRGSNGGVYIGTRRGVYYRDNTTGWQLFNNDLPFNTLSVKLIPYYREGKIRNGTNRSAYECEFYGNSAPSALISVDDLDPFPYCPGQQINFFDRSAVNESGATWQWTFDGGTPASSTDQNPVIAYDTFGVFDVTLTVTDDFGSNTQTLTNFVTIENCFGVGIKEKQQAALDFYPTLIQKGGILNVVNQLNESIRYDLYNAKGKLVQSGTVSGNQIGLDRLSSGSYFIRLIGKTHMLNKSFVVR